MRPQGSAAKGFLATGSDLPAAAIAGCSSIPEQNPRRFVVRASHLAHIYHNVLEATCAEGGELGHQPHEAVCWVLQAAWNSSVKRSRKDCQCSPERTVLARTALSPS